MKNKLAGFLFMLTLSATAHSATVTFFDPSQVATDVASGVTSDTISSNGYLFTYTRDKLFTGGFGLTTPVGRFVTVAWPDGVQAQAVTAGPITSKAQITISRVDGNMFDVSAFTAKLLANTAATGASFEVMPQLNGEDAYNDPFFFNASGYYSSTFSYDTGSMQSTSPLTGFDAYKFTLFVDFALTDITLVDASTAPVPLPAAGWLFGSGLLGLIGMARRKTS